MVYLQCIMSRLKDILAAEDLSAWKVAQVAGLPAQTVYKAAERGFALTTTANRLVKAVNALVAHRVGVHPDYTITDLFGDGPLPDLPKRPALPQGAAA